MKRSTQLKQWYQDRRFFVGALVNNALEAKLAEAVGFQALLVSGSGVAAMCGLPDAGVTTLTELVNTVKYIVNSVSVPVTVDAETGFGNIHNVRRTVRELIQIGAAGIFLEDQAELRRCGFIAGKRVLPVEDAVAKYRAAVDVRNELDPDFVLMARSDARGAVGGSLEEVICRAKTYRAAGMDAMYFEALQSMAEVKTCIDQVGPPTYFSWGAIPLADQPSHEEMAQMGVANIYYSLMRPLKSYPRDRLNWEIAHDVIKRGPKALLEWNEWARAFPWKYPEHPHFHEFMGFAEVRAVEERYLPRGELEKYDRSVGLYTPGQGPEVSKQGVDWR